MSLMVSMLLRFVQYTYVKTNHNFHFKIGQKVIVNDAKGFIIDRDLGPIPPFSFDNEMYNVVIENSNQKLIHIPSNQIKTVND